MVRGYPPALLLLRERGGLARLVALLAQREPRLQRSGPRYMGTARQSPGCLGTRAAPRVRMMCCQAARLPRARPASVACPAARWHALARRLPHRDVQAVAPRLLAISTLCGSRKHPYL